MGSSGATPSGFEFQPTGSSGVSNARRWAVVWLLFVASVINYFDRATISFALPLISHDLHLGPETKGLLLSAFFWSYTLMQVPMGLIVDRWNLLWIYTAAFGIWSLAQGLTGLAGSLLVLVLLRILLGLGESIYLPGGIRIVSNLFGQAERGLPTGIFDFGTRTGLVAEGILVPWLLVHFGWRDTFVLVGLTAFLWLIPWITVFPSQMARRRKKAPPPKEGLRKPFRLVHFNRNLLGICLGFFCFDYFWYLMLTWLPDYLYEARHLSIMKAGIFAAIPYAIFGLSEPVGGWIADRLIRRGWDETRTRKGIVSFAFMFGLLIIPAALARTAGTAVALIMCAGLTGLASANLLVMVQSCAPPDEVGVWTGFENFAGNIGGIVAPLLTGFLVAWTHSFVPAFVLAPTLLISGLLSYWLIIGKLEPPANHELRES